MWYSHLIIPGVLDIFLSLEWELNHLSRTSGLLHKLEIIVAHHYILFLVVLDSTCWLLLKWTCCLSNWRLSPRSLKKIRVGVPPWPLMDPQFACTLGRFYNLCSRLYHCSRVVQFCELHHSAGHWRIKQCEHFGMAVFPPRSTMLAKFISLKLLDSYIAYFCCSCQHLVYIVASAQE